ncbi:MAG TPA: YihY/virulence factor BrkB family protein [Steroidobacteraceae bacterium]|jgi:membrane protein|nr:YihY/virulence factor BrkB family protein [Steroidobacteraceae bacterium]
MFRWYESLEDRLFIGSRSMSPPWGPPLRLLRYPAALIRDWLRGEISVRAMSLAYTTLLSIVPLMVFSFAILKSLGARGDLRFILEQFFAPLGGASDQLTESVLQFVRNMRGDLLGSIGLAFLVYTVVTTIQKVEASFNFLWRVDRPRSFLRRFTEYLAVMILGPILLAVALGLLAGAERSPVAQWVDAIPPLAWTLRTVGRVSPYLIVTVIFTFMFAFIPNTRVQLRAALIGGITSGIVWALVGKVFTAFIVYSSSLVAIYTGFAIVLTTLIWVYLSWLILLIGAQLAFYLQFPQYLRHGQESFELAGRDREQVALSVMYLVGRDFSAGRSAWSAHALAAELDIPSIALAPVLHCLEQNGLILATEKEQFVPGRDIAEIRLAEIFEVVRALHSGRLAVAIRSVGPAVALLNEVEGSMEEPLKGRSLKDFIAIKF